MDRNKKKKINWGFSKLEYKLMEQYLEEMAMKGWLLEEIDKQKAIFTPTNPRKLKFCVDITSKLKKSSYDGDNFDEKYEKSFERLGWRFITSHDKMQFFYAEYYENTYRIHTDIELEQELVIDTVWKKEAYKSLFFLVSLIILSIYIYKFNNKILYYIVLSNWTALMLIPMIYIMAIFSIISKLIWYIKIKSNMNLKVSQKHYKFAKFRNVISDAFNYILQVFSILVLLSSFFPRGILYNFNIKLSVVAILGFVVCSCFLYIRVKEELNKKWKMFFVSSIFIGITILVYFMSRISLDEYTYNPRGIQIISNKYSVINISDFIDTSEIDSNDFTRSYNPLVPINYKYYEYYSDAKNGYNAETEYYKCFNKYIAGIIYDGILDKYKNRNYSNVKIVGISAEYWNCDKATLISEDTLLLLKDNKVIKVEISKYLVNIYDDKLREKIFEKFMKDK